MIVAVIDSGIAYSHPDLAGNIWMNDDPVDGADNDGNGFIDDTHGWDFVQNDNDAARLQRARHARRRDDRRGRQQRARRPRASTGTSRSWRCARRTRTAAFPNAAIVSAITYACANGADVVNGSFGGSGASMTVRDAILSAPCANTLFVFAAGNSGWDLDGNTGFQDQAYPCEFHRPPAEGGASAANILCIGATDRNDVLASFSNHGTSAVHLAAPGVDILSAAPAYSNVVLGELRGHRRAVQRPLGKPHAEPEPVEPHERRPGPAVPSASPTRPSACSVNQDTSIAKLAPFSLAGRTGCRINYNMRLDTDNNQGGNATDDIFWILVNGSTFSGWSGSTLGDWFAFSDDFSLADGMAGLTIGLGHGRRRRRCPRSTAPTSTTLPSPACSTTATRTSSSTAPRWRRRTLPASRRSCWRTIRP